MRVLALSYLALIGVACTPVRYSHDLPPTRPLPQPLSINRPGVLLHEPSGYRFPERLAGFQRVAATVFDVQHQQVAIGYDGESPACRITATVFLDPAPLFTLVEPSDAALNATRHLILQRAYEARKAGVQQAHPGMHSVVEDSLASTPVRGGVLSGRSLTFLEGRSISEVRVFLLGFEWVLTYRFTYPTTCKDEAATRLAELVAALPWAAA